MEGLIKIEVSTNGTQVVSASELHGFLENKIHLSTWFKRQAKKAMLEEGVDYERFTIMKTSGQVTYDYALTLSSAKEISMLSGTDKGKEARLYFIECEKKLASLAPQTYIQALEALLVVKKEEQRLIEENSKKELKIENLETALDSLVEWVSIIKVCQRNLISENAFSWRVLKQKSEAMGYIIKKAESPRFGYQNLYHVNVFKACYPEFDYNFLED